MHQKITRVVMESVLTKIGKKEKRSSISFQFPIILALYLYYAMFHYINIAVKKDGKVLKFETERN